MESQVNLTHEDCPFVLIPEDKRITTYPIPHSRIGLWGWYKDAYRCYWTPDEIPLADDIVHYGRLTDDERHFVNYVLAFFASADTIVNENLAARFRKDVGLFEAGYFYDYQIMMENIHAQAYSELLNTIISDQAQREYLLDAVKTIPAVTRMAEYMRATIASSAPLAERLLRMACVEGIFFTGCFCAIYWLKKRGLMPGLCFSNELIARDEALHTMFAMYLYDMLRAEYKLAPERVYEIFAESVDIAAEFITAALPIRLKEMNADLMIEYIQSRVDDMLSLIDLDPLYGVTHGFDFMSQQNHANRTNFFERRVSEYAKPAATDLSEFAVAKDF
jgi:ribonucleotide reductase beta subunit family protein with ferritin-like domain